MAFIRKLVILRLDAVAANVFAGSSLCSAHSDDPQLQGCPLMQLVARDVSSDPTSAAVVDETVGKTQSTSLSVQPGSVLLIGP